ATFIASNVGPEVARNSPEHIERFPAKREEAFKYDLVILGDVDSDFFTEEELGLLEELIRDRGASLLMLCGPMHSPASYAGTPVQTMLPVEFDPDEKWEQVSESIYPVLTPEGRSSLVMTLENEDGLNDRIWSRMAPMDQLPPLLGAKPGATVLAALSDSTERDQSYPLVAWQRYGTGKCMSIASDRLWRLRFKTGDKYHWRVWSQCIQFMTLSRLMGEHKRIRLETDRSSYSVGSQGRLYAHVLDDNFEPVLQSGFDVVVSGLDGTASGQQIKLQPDRSQPGLYEGYFTPPGPGRYRMEANEDDREISSVTEFQVSDFRQELADTDMRLNNLKRISGLTGGVTLGVRELPRLSSLVESGSVTTTVRSERPLWDHWFIILLIVALLGAEWILRRRHDLP
ncbi:glutamine amidotransferase, partial [bacterium]|nr:glutamine amidotransferase [bacterium]